MTGSFPVPTIANPTSALFKAGPSFVPSPVTATTSRFGFILLSMIPLTSVYLSVGDDLASTRSFGQTLSNSSGFTWQLICQTFTPQINYYTKYYFNKNRRNMHSSPMEGTLGVAEGTMDFGWVEWRGWERLNGLKSVRWEFVVINLWI